MKAQRLPTLPVIRLALIRPVLDVLDSRDIDYSGVLDEFAIRPEHVGDMEFWIPAAKLYSLIEHLSEISGDTHFGVYAGELLNPWDWPPTANAARASRNVSEFLLRFMADSQEDVNSCFYVLNTVNDRTTFREQRVTDGGVWPRHNDGYTVTYLLAILRGAMGSAWDGARVVAQVCDPDVIPNGYLGIRVAKTDTMGASISFPTDWLLLPLDVDASAPPAGNARIGRVPGDSFVDAFRHAVAPYIHDPGLDSERIADICGMSKRSLARKLASLGTSGYREISRIRRSRAEQLLRETDEHIAAIALSVGYSDPAVFSRAFRRWTGVSPRAFRLKKS